MQAIILAATAPPPPRRPLKPHPAPASPEPPRPKGGRPRVPDGYLDADTPLEVIVRHVHYLVDKLGVDGVAFGSDFDGETLPQGLKDVTGLPKLIAALRRHGYDDTTLSKRCSGNWLSVLRRTWRA